MININFNAQGSERLIQRVRVLLATPKGSIPHSREFGISNAFLDNPTPLSIAQAKAEIVEQIETYIPEITIREITIQPGEDDSFFVYVDF